MSTLITLLALLMPLIYTIFYQLGLNNNSAIVTKPRECDPNRASNPPICELNLVPFCAEYTWDPSDPPQICNTDVSWVTNCHDLTWYISGVTMHIIGNISYFILIVWRIRKIYNNITQIAENNPDGPLNNDLPQIKCCSYCAIAIGFVTSFSWLYTMVMCVPYERHGDLIWSTVLGMIIYQFFHVACSALEVGYNSNRTICEIFLLLIFWVFAVLSVIFLYPIGLWVQVWFFVHSYIWHYAFYAFYSCNWCSGCRSDLLNGNAESETARNVELTQI